MPQWTWDQGKAIYRSETGDVLDANDLRRLRDEFANSLDDLIAGIMLILFAKANVDQENVDIAKVAMWEERMRLLLKDTLLAEYLLGRGGTWAMTQADWGRVGGMIRNLYSYLSQFAADIASGSLSVDAANARAAMYVGAGVYAYERGRQAAYGVPRLPGYPGQGTSCLSNCRCSWQIKDKGDAWEASWRLEEGAKHCPECLNRASAWSALVIKKQ